MQAKFLFRLFLFLLLISSSIHKAFAQSTEVQYPHYVIIGAFSIQQNAENFTAQAIKQKLQAEYQFNPNRNLYYVYVLSTQEYRKALLEARRLRRQSQYAKAWIYNGPLGTVAPPDQEQTTDINPETGKKIEVATTSQDSSRTVSDVAGDSSAVASDSSKTVDESSDVPDNGEKNFIFEIYRGMNNAIVEGEVSVIDANQAKKLATYQGNTLVKIAKPKNETGDIILVCEVFGYRKVQRNVNWVNPAGEDIVVDSAGNVVIPFELVRLQKGDIVVMYNVYFLKDAAIMRPDSKYEVNSLLDMLNENPAYKIKIHGHTNGNAPGKIITRGENNFFSLTDSKDGVGSAKKLSLERSKLIMDYLVSNGIAAERMQVKAWGGKRPLYDKHGPRAQENVRVEIEILEDK